MRKFLIKYVPNRSVQDEVATHLEDMLNDLDSKGYVTQVEERADGGYMLHSQLRETRTTESEAPQVMMAKVGIEDLLALMKNKSGDDINIIGGEAILFVTTVVSQLSALNVEAAKKEAPAIVKKMVANMPVDKIKVLADECHKSIGHKPGECQKCDIYNVVADALTTTATLNLS